MKPGHYDTLTGFKATHADMTCQGFKFKLGVWYHIPESQQLKLCETGFHFCIHPSGPRTFYLDITDRIFRCEAKDVLVQDAHGAAVKCVARHIRLVSEIKPSGDGNTGDRNTGDRNAGNENTGDYNTGNRNAGSGNTGGGNTGDYNTGHDNTGDCNAGDLNAGNRNTGDDNKGHCNAGSRNTGNGNTGFVNKGHCNAGNENTGDYNTGNRNAGDYNTGDYNTGSGNTGSGNATDNCTGFFCTKEPGILCFDTPTNLTRTEFLARYSAQVHKLAQQLAHPKKFDYTAYKTLPGWSLRKIKALHMKVQQP
jgi:hypothetical protein